MFRTTMILIVLVLVALASVPAMAVDWVLDTGYSTPAASYASFGNVFGASSDMPTWASFTGTAIPDVRVTYHIAENNYGLGNFGVALWLGATPRPSTGLFGAMSGQWFGLQTVGVGASSGYPNQYAFDYSSNDWGFQDNGFDVDMQVVTTDGVTTVTAAVTGTTNNYPNLPGYKTVVATFDATSSVASWASNNKLAAFASTPATGFDSYGQAVSNIQFYQAVPVPEPGSLLMLGMGAVGLAGLLRRRSR